MVAGEGGGSVAACRDTLRAGLVQENAIAQPALDIRPVEEPCLRQAGEGLTDLTTNLWSGVSASSLPVETAAGVPAADYFFTQSPTDLM